MSGRGHSASQSGENWKLLCKKGLCWWTWGENISTHRKSQWPKHRSRKGSCFHWRAGDFPWLSEEFVEQAWKNKKTITPGERNPTPHQFENIGLNQHRKTSLSHRGKQRPIHNECRTLSTGKRALGRRGGVRGYIGEKRKCQIQVAKSPNKTSGREGEKTP